jgi:hypothetical protein
VTWPENNESPTEAKTGHVEKKKSASMIWTRHFRDEKTITRRGRRNYMTLWTALYVLSCEKQADGDE